MGRQEFERQPVMADMLAGRRLSRFGRPDDVAAIANCLRSDLATHVSETDVRVDGAMLQGMASPR
jgi:NAD(P)-dependent dehydrogenase (short-subunit alcohol dehydrogenase family)